MNNFILGKNEIFLQCHCFKLLRMIWFNLIEKEKSLPLRTSTLRERIYFFFVCKIQKIIFRRLNLWFSSHQHQISRWNGTNGWNNIALGQRIDFASSVCTEALRLCILRTDAQKIIIVIVPFFFIYSKRPKLLRLLSLIVYIEVTVFFGKSRF